MSRRPMGSTSPGGSLTRRQWGLGAALALTLAATLWASQWESTAPAPVTARVARTAAPVASTGLSVPLASVRAIASQSGPGGGSVLVPRTPWGDAEPAELSAWQPPAPPASPPPQPAQRAAPPAAPVAPAFPYELIGRLDDETGPQALLSSPNRSWGARPGDTLDGQWRLLAFTPEGLQVQWLPGRLPQTVNYKAP